MRYLLILLAAATFFSCQNGQKPAATASVSSEKFPFATAAGQPLPTDFVDFYEKFHADSVFQMSRIQWPVQGEEVIEVNDSTRAVTPMTWTAENWQLHHPPDFQGDLFVREFSMLGDAMVIEVIFNQNLGLRQERRFAKVAGDDWALIYFFKM